MPRCGVTFDETASPLGQGGTSGGLWEAETNPLRPSLFSKFLDDSL